MAIYREPEPLVKRSRIVDELPNCDPVHMHLSKLYSLQDDDILIFPDQPVIYEYDESLSSEYYPGKKIKVSFVVCKLLRHNGEVKDYNFYPLEMITTFYEKIKRSRKIEYNNPLNHSIDGVKATDWFDKYSRQNHKSLKAKYLSPLEGKIYLVKTSTVLTWRSNTLFPKGLSEYSNILSLQTIDKETSNRLINDHKQKNRIFEITKKAKEIINKYEYGFHKFSKEFNIKEPYNNSDYDAIINSEKQIELYNAQYRAERIMLANPEGMRSYYKDRRIDTRSLSGCYDIITNQLYISQAQYRYEEVEKNKILEPKYAKSPYLERIKRGMNRIKENYFKECELVEILFNYSDEYDIIALFGKTISEIADYEYNDTRTTLHYPSGFFIKYQKGITKENLIRKIIDNIEKYKTENM